MTSRCSSIEPCEHRREQHLQWNHPPTLRQCNRATEFSASADEGASSWNALATFVWCSRCPSRRAEALADLVVHLKRGAESALVGTAPSRARVARLDRIRCDDCNCRETRDVLSSHRYAVRTGVAAAAVTWRLASQPPVAPPAILSACAT